MRFHRKTFFDAMRKRFGPRLREMQVQGAEALLAAIEEEEGLEDVRQAAYLFATAWHETDTTLQSIAEYGSRKYFDRRYDPVLGSTSARRARARRMGNTEQGDGYKFRGRGPTQMTWHVNYKRASDELGVDFVADPDLALDPQYAYKILVRGVLCGWWTGKRLDQYINGHRCDYPGARRTVNGTDRAQAIAVHARHFEACLRAALAEDPSSPVLATSLPAGRSPLAGDEPGEPVVAAAKTRRYKPKAEETA